MNIHSENSRNIIIELSPDDLEGLDITFEDMDYSNIETRRVIWTLLDLARIELGRDIDPSSRMLIEVSAAESGGCVLCFTALAPEADASPRRLMIKKHFQKDCCVWEFKNLACFAAACRAALPYIEQDPQIFSSGGKYRLMLNCPAEANIKLLLAEFGELVHAPFAAQRTCEEWRSVDRENAVRAFARLA